MTDNQWGIIITLHLGSLGVYGVMLGIVTKWIISKMNSMKAGITQKEFDAHVKQFDELVIDVKHQKDVTQTKESCAEVKNFIYDKINDQKDYLESKIDSATETICAKIDGMGN